MEVVPETLRSISKTLKSIDEKLVVEQPEKPGTVYLLYEGDEHLYKGSMVLMGIFTSEEKLKAGAEKLIRQRAGKHLTRAEANSIYDFENPRSDDNKEEIDIIVEGIMAELFSNDCTSGWDVNYQVVTAETDKLEEIV